jgi:FAD/FMN-containing dehydrogenase
MALGRETIEAMRRIKRALDPRGILNPGKVFV